MATLIIISGLCSTISSAQEGRSSNIRVNWHPGPGVVLDLSIPDLCTLTYCNMVNKLFEPRTVFRFLKIVPFVNPLDAKATKIVCFFFVW